MIDKASVVAALVTLGTAVALGGFRRAPVRRPGGSESQRLPRPTRRASVPRRHINPPPGAVSEWASDLSRHLRGGTTLREALRTTVPAHPPLRDQTAPLRLAIENGDHLDDAVAALPTGRESPHLDLVSVVLVACHRIGGSAAEPLDRAAGTLRGRAADQEERQAHSAQAQLSARVMTVLPLAALALLATSDPTVREQLRTTVGLACVAIGLGLNGIGWLWMRRIARGVT